MKIYSNHSKQISKKYERVKKKCPKLNHSFDNLKIFYNKLNKLGNCLVILLYWQDYEQVHFQ